jgi:hypothetical protein
MKRRDYWVTVCAECRRASCWHAEFPCEKYKTANVERVRASVLREANREHPSQFSVRKLREVCGEVEYIEAPR